MYKDCVGLTGPPGHPMLMSAVSMDEFLERLHIYSMLFVMGRKGMNNLIL